MLAGQQIEARHGDLRRIVGRRNVEGLQLTPAEIIEHLPYASFGIPDDHCIEERLTKARIGACHYAAEHRLGSTAAPVVCYLPSTIEIRVKAADEQEVVVAVPVWVFPRFIDDLYVYVVGKKTTNQGAYAGLRKSSRFLPFPTVVHVDADNAYSHGPLPMSSSRSVVPVASSAQPAA